MFSNIRVSLRHLTEQLGHELSDAIPSCLSSEDSYAYGRRPKPLLPPPSETASTAYLWHTLVESGSVNGKRYVYWFVSFRVGSVFLLLAFPCFVATLLKFQNQQVERQIARSCYPLP